jgi:hypothetical protein
VLVEVNKKIVKHLKPHQVGGIKFMWDSVFESKKVSISIFRDVSADFEIKNNPAET